MPYSDLPHDGKNNDENMGFFIISFTVEIPEILIFK